MHDAAPPDRALAAASTRHRRFPSVMAVLFGLLAFSNFTKALQHLSNPARGGLVVFGVRFETFASNAMLGPLFGLVLAFYAYGLWNMRSWVRPLSIAYAFYVPTNLVLFWFLHAQGDHPPLTGLLVYLAVAFTGSIGTALYLASHRDQLS
jgi:hypothetical protein